MAAREVRVCRASGEFGDNGRETINTPTDEPTDWWRRLRWQMLAAGEPPGNAGTTGFGRGIGLVRGRERRE